MILLVVDTQKLNMTNKLYNFDSLVSNIEQLITTALKNKIEIVYIRHDDGPDTELTEGFDIYGEFQPTTHERIFDKTVNSAFKGTGLLEYLKEKGTKKIVVAGLQTDFCIDATVKCGFEHGFQMIVSARAHSTEDNHFMSGENSYKYYNEWMWPECYATCISMEETIKEMEHS
ncbi:cysteine hydrolase family protein [Listeria monocytogenes]|uniref:Cysteine hydrolase n=1 Tax=Listeria monocytogenes TaxID=1639 RepID=A0A823J8H2_LISMN|nr:cysteine hydrolase family protein [Listeria monocytogenes]EAG9220804.1 cysteine hydrolase [Listeria monocytogenes]EAG9229982.1 cysteine hydrolase [Listeria monocytogenes]EAG9321267.1 cysteine hydrolase [Listeria monocytogenes]EAG9352668.1 cysteine hydrolase [Listeria monocytogenes]OET18107.1 amidase [Listeria monocytogenes]